MATANVLNDRDQRRADTVRMMTAVRRLNDVDTSAPLEPIEFDPAVTPPSEVFYCLKPYTRSEYAERIGRKCCPSCKVIRPLDEYSPDPNGVGGRTGYCKPCNAAYTRFYKRHKAMKAVTA